MKCAFGGGEMMGQQLRALAILSEKLGLVLSNNPEIYNNIF